MYLKTYIWVPKEHTHKKLSEGKKKILELNWLLFSTIKIECSRKMKNKNKKVFSFWGLNLSLQFVFPDEDQRARQEENIYL